MTPLATFAVHPSPTVPDLDRLLADAAVERRAAAVVHAMRDDEGTRAALDACRDREDDILDKRLELTR